MTIKLEFPPKVYLVLEYAENPKLKEIYMKLDEAIAAVQGVSTQLAKAKQEILDKIAALEAAAGGDLSPEQQAAVDELKAAAQGLDDVVAD